MEKKEISIGDGCIKERLPLTRELSNECETEGEITERTSTLLPSADERLPPPSTEGGTDNGQQS